MSSAPVESTSQALPARKGLPLLAKIILWIAAVIVVLILVVYGVGMATPLDYQVTKSRNLKVDQQTVYDTLVDWEKYPEWRTELASVTAVPDDDGDPRWREEWKGGDPVELEMTAEEPGQRVELTIRDPSEMFSGTWEFILAPADGGSMVTITERGNIPNPGIRGMMAIIPGVKGYCLNLFMTGLAKKFGEAPSGLH